MLIRLTDDQIAKYWPDIRFAVSKSLPPTLKGEGDKMNRILEALLAGTAQCWASVDRETKQLDGVVTTSVVEDYLTGAKSLMIYTIYGYRPSIINSWKEGYETLVKYAKSKNCGRLIGFTSEKRIVDIVGKFGGNTDFTLCMMEV